MYQPEIEQEIRERGYANVGRLLGDDEIAVVRAALQKAVDTEIATWSGNPWYKDHWMVHNLMMHDTVFLDLLENPVMHDYLSRLLSPFCTLYAYTSSSLPPNGSNFSRRIHVDAQSESLDYITNVGVLIALDDFSDENGATYYLPGSHLSLEAPTEETFFRDAKRVYPKAGEAVIFNARTFHYGGTNSTNTARHAVTLNVCRHWMKQRFDYPRMLRADQADRLSERGRSFLGYDSRIPVNLEEYYVPPSDRLFKAGQY